MRHLALGIGGDEFQGRRDVKEPDAAALSTAVTSPAPLPTRLGPQIDHSQRDLRRAQYATSVSATIKATTITIQNAKEMVSGRISSDSARIVLESLRLPRRYVNPARSAALSEPSRPWAAGSWVVGAPRQRPAARRARRSSRQSAPAPGRRSPPCAPRLRRRRRAGTALSAGPGRTGPLAAAGFLLAGSRVGRSRGRRGHLSARW
jgi:hypothetical protein